MALKGNGIVQQVRPLVIAVVVALATAVVVAVRAQERPPTGEPVAAVKTALTVSVTALRPDALPMRVLANGSVAAWQEASIGAEANGLRLAAVNVNVGDVVRRGQVVATFASETVSAELEQSRAAVSEAEAEHAEAAENARRALALLEAGLMPAQQMGQYATAERTARARLDARRAAERAQELRLAQVCVLAPDDGVISSRRATVGAVLQAGEELFRLIRRGRLEWRAEVPAADLPMLRPSQIVRVTPVGGGTIEGRVRTVAPAVDPQNRKGLVYVDLPSGAPARAGMFARGEFDLGTDRSVTLPQGAVLMRDGFSYVMRVDRGSRALQTKVVTGRRMGDRVEILSGLQASAQVVASGGGFLADGDLVWVVEAPGREPR